MGGRIKSRLTFLKRNSHHLSNNMHTEEWDWKDYSNFLNERKFSSLKKIYRNLNKKDLNYITLNEDSHFWSQSFMLCWSPFHFPFPVVWIFPCNNSLSGAQSVLNPFASSFWVGGCQMVHESWEKWNCLSTSGHVRIRPKAFSNTEVIWRHVSFRLKYTKTVFLLQIVQSYRRQESNKSKQLPVSLKPSLVILGFFLVWHWLNKMKSHINALFKEHIFLI
jgi:hypothetical protein